MKNWTPNCRCSNCRPISLADAENHLLSGIYYFAIAEEDAACENNQSCDCNEVIVCTKQGLLLIRSEYEPHIYDDDDGGRFSFYSIDGYQAAYYNMRISSQSSEAISFDKFHFLENKIPIAIRFCFASRYLYIFSFDLNLVITKSRYELFCMMYDDENEGEPTSMGDEDSILFDQCNVMKNRD